MPTKPHRDSMFRLLKLRGEDETENEDSDEDWDQRLVNMKRKSQAHLNILGVFGKARKKKKRQINIDLLKSHNNNLILN